MDALTRCPEYRNGGLLLDAGVLALQDAAEASAPPRGRERARSSSGAR
jgi:hypothetical protein